MVEIQDQLEVTSGLSNGIVLKDYVTMTIISAITNLFKFNNNNIPHRCNWL